MTIESFLRKLCVLGECRNATGFFFFGAARTCLIAHANDPRGREKKFIVRGREAFIAGEKSLRRTKG